MNNISQKRRIIEYLKKNISKGYPSDTLKWALINQGYGRTVVESSLEEAHKEIAKKAPPLKDKPVIRHEILDENDNIIKVLPPKKTPWWKRIFGIN